MLLRGLYMKKIKYLHIMHNDKFIAPYIEFINENFRSEEHFFLIIDGFSKNKIPWKEWKNTFYCEKITLKNTRLRWLLMYVAKQKIMSILTVLR